MKRTPIVLAAAAVLAVVAGTWWHQSRSALWRIVSDDCARIGAAGGSPPRCRYSPESAGEPRYAMLRDRRGLAQYLLIPTRRITGIEDDALQEPGSGRLLADAWNERGLLELAAGRPVPREAVALSVNSRWSRSQDQLHIHVDCVRPDLRAYLRAHDTGIGNAWAPLPGGWNGHAYQARRLVAPSLDGTELFGELGRQHPGEMGRQSLAVVAGSFQGQPAFWLLQSQVDLSSGWLGGIEADVQDHDCAVLKAAGP